MALFVAQSVKISASKMDGLVPNPEEHGVLGWRHLILAEASHDRASARAATPLDNQVRQIKTAFNRLASDTIGIVVQPRKGTPRSRYKDMFLLNEGGVLPTGRAANYQRPRPAESTVAIPIGFFLNGCVHVLDDSELAPWLMFRHRCGAPPAPPAPAGPPTVELSGQDRLAIYGLARTVWDKHQLLGVLGLMRHEADPRRRRNGSVEEFATLGSGMRHRFQMVDERLSGVAVHSALADIAADLDDPEGSWFSRSRVISMGDSTTT